MSYDIEVVGAPYSAGSRNYTSNIAPMLYENGFWWREYHGQRVVIVEQRLTILIRAMEDDPKRFKKHDPANGWGDYQGCLNWLRRIREDCMDAIEGGYGWSAWVYVSS